MPRLLQDLQFRIDKPHIAFDNQDEDSMLIIIDT